MAPLSCCHNLYGHNIYGPHQSSQNKEKCLKAQIIRNNATSLKHRTFAKDFPFLPDTLLSHCDSQTACATHGTWQACHPHNSRPSFRISASVKDLLRFPEHELCFAKL